MLFVLHCLSYCNNIIARSRLVGLAYIFLDSIVINAHYVYSFVLMIDLVLALARSYQSCS